MLRYKLLHIYRVLLSLFIISFTSAQAQVRGDMIMAPHYSVENGVGVMFAYTLQQKFTFMGNISSEGSTFVGITANHAAYGGRWHMYYDAFYYASKPYTWGIGYNNASLDANKMEHAKQNLTLRAKGLYKLNRNMSAGPLVGYEWIEWEGICTSKAFTYGAEGKIDT